jgi:hypothetical protein
MTPGRENDVGKEEVASGGSIDAEHSPQSLLELFLPRALLSRYSGTGLQE